MIVELYLVTFFPYIFSITSSGDHYDSADDGNCAIKRPRLDRFESLPATLTQEHIPVNITQDLTHAIPKSEFILFRILNIIFKKLTCDFSGDLKWYFCL